jgi:hypothetical protein
LAAAFNLGFVGEEEEAPVQRTVRQPVNPAAVRNPMNPGPSAAAVPAPRQKRFRKIKALLLLLVLAGAGYGVAVAVKPELYEQSKVWGQQKLAWIQEKLETLSQQTEADKLGDQPRKAPARPETTKPATPVDGTANAEAPSAPPRPIEEPVTKPAAPPIVPPVTPPAGGNSWVGSPVQKLYNEAFDLEDTDPALALGKYKQIKQNFSSDKWPTDLEVRIQRVEAIVRKMVSEPKQ